MDLFNDFNFNPDEFKIYQSVDIHNNKYPINDDFDKVHLDKKKIKFIDDLILVGNFRVTKISKLRCLINGKTQRKYIPILLNYEKVVLFLTFFQLAACYILFQINFSKLTTQYINLIFCFIVGVVGIFLNESMLKQFNGMYLSKLHKNIRINYRKKFNKLSRLNMLRVDNYVCFMIVIFLQFVIMYYSSFYIYSLKDVLKITSSGLSLLIFLNIMFSLFYIKIIIWVLGVFDKVGIGFIYNFFYKIIRYVIAFPIVTFFTVPEFVNSINCLVAVFFINLQKNVKILGFNVPRLYFFKTILLTISTIGGGIYIFRN